MATALMKTPAPTPADPDAVTARAWVDDLRAEGPRGRAAVAELHALLLTAARFEIGRRGAEVAHLRGGDQEDLAQQAADDALMAVLRKLDEFRGESRFTTWAYKFALLEAAVKVRRRAWQGREIPLEDEAWMAFADASAPAGRPAEDAELFAALREEIERSLSPRQREVLVAVALNGVPIDVLAERLGSTRGALYKNLHDARRKLRAALAGRGFRVGTEGEEER
ncbi:MAG TPA: sigma-70 family RNA polymerase sigma factor [Solirubrobacterales bacterium]|nr:sigma-70 family RNA polymerase sigma factor [Solirubrobacterales bacterium]